MLDGAGPTNRADPKRPSRDRAVKNGTSCGAAESDSNVDVALNDDDVVVTEREITFARPEYAALAHEFGFLASAFGHDVSPKGVRDIARLASSIERIDRCIDEVSDDAKRQRRWSEVVAHLEDANADHD